MKDSAAVARIQVVGRFIDNKLKASEGNQMDPNKRNHGVDLSMPGEDVTKLFGLAVKNSRKVLGVSQEKLAERAGLHRTYISDIERGARNVTLRNIWNLARALEIPVYTLFKSL